MKTRLIQVLLDLLVGLQSHRWGVYGFRVQGPQNLKRLKAESARHAHVVTPLRGVWKTCGKVAEVRVASSFKMKESCPKAGRRF